jgi:HEAT repeat protein
MNCRERQHDIVLFLYDELSGEARQDLRAHLDGCEACQAFHRHEKQLQFELTEDFSYWEVPADLLVESRRELSDSLDRIDQGRQWWRFPGMTGVLTRMRALESVALMSMGLALGVYLSNPIETPVLQPAEPSIPQNASVTNLRIIESDPDTGDVELAGDMVQPMRLSGNLQDQAVRQILVEALQSLSNPGVRLRAVELMSPNARDPKIKETLMDTLVNDDNPGIRLEALQALESFSQEDDVRQVLKYVVETDDNPGIRVQAVEAMAPMTQEEAMEAVIQEAVREVPNEYIRMRQLQFVGGN